MARCPYCRSEAAERVKFTAWGGVVGPVLLSLRKCASCGGHYNGRTGRCVKRAIRFYTLATLVILALLMAVVMYNVASSGGGFKGMALGCVLLG